VTGRRVVPDHNGDPVTERDVYPIDPPTGHDPGTCEACVVGARCWVVTWETAMELEYPRHVYPCGTANYGACSDIETRRETGDVA
jgi:hypothetical protein